MVCVTQMVPYAVVHGTGRVMMMGAVVTVVVIIMYLRSGSSSQTYYKGVVRVLPLWGFVCQMPSACSSYHLGLFVAAVDGYCWWR